MTFLLARKRIILAHLLNPYAFPITLQTNLTIWAAPSPRPVITEFQFKATQRSLQPCPEALLDPPVFDRGAAPLGFSALSVFPVVASVA